ncbi:MAG: 30S ribosomal protein S2 [Candidatus Magasanikbacteria bacterium RIFCSPHIGHO2_01_FULL_33_34]|uniref:Small ribosomal subunit protein uS2 n=1 Tax=Candidatus Magasanikbacteria bacterium RIFCSPHIGHO2_01_FULL_33_34 TaxID=1798671 RepID=A0A1F6LH54_9BACT|nr:MAG: 30S ribosomal protein S2 [Candidatus Magasanikbacteria bacterium RIFCSPHIGHO2_01_FULL_33_34]OGH66083.1 MAG: 30S ribosomal protein S2 [Candidatus Magasanikbacteria bacterium RIFCSPHIGHO2_02_FULL_33_17]OGH75929.1 MAG: 30S ribosomal protein S2 [Candidatus Magasanikbacteria bacterium RIFCSPLOWO2_01_FULL_33_34]OGH81583.1 MAG: 30S ribosomal protein S2 [Candidatus Magasanikbacteria bacterium RIFCSPLOWO2_12_FULL_34_7]
MKIPSILEMLQAGVHFGHQSSRWHPKMEEYIFTERNGVHVIDLEKTKLKLEETLEAVRALAAEGKEVLFITTKVQAREIVKEAAISCDSPYLVERWVGGLLTNFDEMKKLFKKYNDIKEQKENGELERYTKQERSKILKDLEKMEKTLVGLAHLEEMPDVLFVPALQREKTAVMEANKTGVPIIGICDTNSNPDKAEYIIPANDDAVNSIRMMVNLIAEAVKEGKEEYNKKNPTIKVPVSLKKAERPPEKQKRGLDWT